MRSGADISDLKMGEVSLAKLPMYSFLGLSVKSIWKRKFNPITKTVRCTPSQQKVNLSGICRVSKCRQIINYQRTYEKISVQGSSDPRRNQSLVVHHFDKANLFD